MTPSRVAGLSLVGLLDAFDETEDRTEDEMPTVRGWLMDELERRNHDAFDAWIDSDCPSPREFFLTGNEPL